MALPAPALAAADHDAQGWFTVNATGSLKGPVMANFEVLGRASEDQGRIYEAEMTGQIGYKLSKAVTVWAGYTRVPGYRGALPTVIEQRARQQVTASLGKLAGGTLASRSLLEQRFREGVNETGWRFRQQFKWSHPLRRGGKTAFVLGHESFIGLNRTEGQTAGYQRMRNLIALNMPIAKPIKAEFGYLNQYDFRKSATDRIAHAATVTLSYAF